MGSLRYRKRIRLWRGTWINVNRRSVGISTGTRGIRVSRNTDRGGTTSVGVPGTGLYYRWSKTPVPGPPPASWDVSSRIP
jgi:hypothetical protein